jgi:hypothetical protein
MLAPRLQHHAELFCAASNESKVTALTGWRSASAETL